MEQEKLHQLLEKYHTGQCSDAELEALQQWYDRLGGASESPSWDVNDEEYLREHYTAFQQRAVLKPVTRQGRIWKRVAAAAAIIVVSALAARHFYPLPVANTTPPAAAVITARVAPAPASDQAVNYDRHLVLPDSSVVLLRAGSTLSLSSSFKEADRLVTLQGEAYFEVRHNARHPFVVRSADVYTYVLGTAFNINTRSKRQVTITVTSGKVRVERENKIMAVLTKNQELVCREHQPPVPATLENVTPQVAWMAKDLLFNETSLEMICQRLSARYQVHFTFDAQVSKEKRVTITDAFYGTESLNDILDIVCTTLGYAYSVAGNTVTITTL
ncbi:FecR family protein [Chitinophaga qingshengii]|uniref:FecR family protein n=1 Tax=Chitinophaga qingshengii TaxID=1569794 RepID=A0ABR7TRS2_9BACT|nr:FecR family protein [Chitinophaga qingshengii]MBC9932084.1 FecR family protein [Chitinophaga qingshengii]